MARLFISHSSRDNVQALAFQSWLSANGWDKGDVFIDLHDIGAGENWRKTLRKANHACEAVILLASPEALGSVECQKELDLAEALGKEIIVAILRDLSKDDARLARYSDRQFVDLSAFPQDHIEALSWDGREHRIQFNRDALARIKTRLDELGISPESFIWPPKNVADPEPYPGLAAFGEDDAGIFFGRDTDTSNALTEIRKTRRLRSPRLIVVVAASGAGKSSFLRAGLWPRLKRLPEFAPLAILRPAQGIISGPDGIGRRIAPWFERFGQPRAPGAIHAPLLSSSEEVAAKAFTTLISDAVNLASEARRATVPDARSPAALFAIDQAEELFAAEDDAESRRFMMLLAGLLKFPPDGIDPYLVATIRADSLQSLMNRVAELGLDPPKLIPLQPLSAAAYREVIMKPAELYSARVRRLVVEPALADAMVVDATGGNALPLVAFTLSRMFADYRADGQLTLARYDEMGGIGGSIGRALKRAQSQAGAAGTDAHLRRLLLPRMATWDPAADGGRGAAKRIVARRQDVLGAGRADLEPLASALVEARLLIQGKDTIEVAHEVLLRRQPVVTWLEEDRGFLMWRDSTGKSRAAYEANARGLLVGRELQIARDWLARRSDREDIAGPDRAFIAASIAEEDRHRNEEEEREKKHRAAELDAVRARELAALEAAKVREANAALEAKAAKEREAEAREREAEAREQAARQAAESHQREARRRAYGMIVAMALATVAAGAGIRAFQQQHLAEAKSEEAEGARSVAVEQANAAQSAMKGADKARQEAQKSQFRLIANMARDKIKEGNATEGALLALEAVADERSEDPAVRSRPLIPEAFSSLNEAVRELDERVILKGHDNNVRGIAYMPDGSRIVTASSDGTARIWDTATGAEVMRLTGHGAAVTAVAVMPDGAHIVTASDDATARVWDAKTGAELLKLEGHTGYIVALAVSNDGSRIITGGYDNTAKIWDAATGKLLNTLKKHRGVIVAAAFSPDGKHIVTASRDRTLRIWDAETGADPEQIDYDKNKGVSSTITAIAFSPDGTRIAAGLTDKTARIWDIASKEEIKTFSGHSSAVNSVAFSPDGLGLITASGDGTVRGWDTREGTEVFVRRGHGGPVRCIAVSPDGKRIASGSNDRTARIWERSEGSLRTLEGHEDTVRSVAVSSDGSRIVTASQDGSVKIFDAVKGDFVSSPITTAATGVAVSADGKRIVYGTADKVTHIWIEGGEERSLKPHDAPITSVAMSASGERIVTGSEDTTAHVSDLKIGEGKGPQIEPIELKHDKKVTSVAISPDGSMIVTGSEDNKVRVWDPAKGSEPISVLRGHTGQINSLAISPDGNLIAVGSDDATTRIWDVKEPRKEPRTLKGHSDGVQSVAFSPDGKTIMTGSDDSTAKIWDVETGSEWATLRGHKGGVLSVAYFPDGIRAVTGSNDNSARIWRLHRKPSELIDEAKQLVPRCLTRSQLAGLQLTPPEWCGAQGKWPYDPVGGLIEAKRYLENNDEESAEDIIGMLKRHAPAVSKDIDMLEAAAFVPRGRTALDDDDDEKAKLWFEKALERNPAAKKDIDELWVAAFVDRGRKNLVYGHDEEAKKNFAAALALDPNAGERIEDAKVGASLARAETAYTEGRTVEALTQFASLAEAHSGMAQKVADFLIGRVDPLLSTISVNPNDEKTKARATEALAAAETAIDWANRRDLPPLTRGNALYARARALGSLQKNAESITAYRQAIELGTTRAYLLYARAVNRYGLQLREEKKLGASLVTFWSFLLDLRPAARRSYLTDRDLMTNGSYARTIALMHTERVIGDATQVPECDRAAGDPYDALRVEADGILVAKIDPDVAVAACNKAVKDEPGEPRHLYNRARAYAKQASKAKSAGNEAVMRTAYQQSATDRDAAIEKQYPAAFLDLASTLRDGLGLKQDPDKAAKYFMEGLNRTLACCWAPVARKLVAEKEQHDPAQLKRILRELTQWSAALGSAPSRALLDELAKNGTIEAASPPAPVSFAETPPWFRDDWNAGATGADANPPAIPAPPGALLPTAN